MNADEPGAHEPVAGRSCPLAYRYHPSDMAVPATAQCEVLYVVGGLYGNSAALDEVLAMFERERGEKRLVFNGDFNWFDIDADVFRRINEHVLQHDAIRGNVETEIAGDNPSAGCGCAYPESVDQETVDRSNRISARLGVTAHQQPEVLAALRALPMWLRVDVGDLRVAIVHGDAESLAGWRFAQDALAEADSALPIDAWFDAAAVDLFASTHTCLPVLRRWSAQHGRAARAVVNNGAAGMPNFHGTRHGLLTRIGVRPYEGDKRAYGTSLGGGVVDALRIDYDAERFASEFLAQWAVGSDAHRSYWSRIQGGLPYHLRDAVMGAGAT